MSIPLEHLETIQCPKCKHWMHPHHLQIIQGDSLELAWCAKLFCMENILYPTPAPSPEDDDNIL